LTFFVFKPDGLLLICSPKFIFKGVHDLASLIFNSASLQLQQQKKSKQKMPPLTKLTLFIHDYGLWDACAKE